MPIVATMSTVEAQWSTFDFEAMSGRLRDLFSSGPLELIHAYNNIIWTDRSVVYKLTSPRFRSRSITSLRSVVAIAESDPTFPTVLPLSEKPIDIDLGFAGKWVVTLWEYRDLSPLQPSETDIESYSWLGRVLRRLHAIEMAGLSRHDALQWTRERVEALADHPDGPALRDKLKSLEIQQSEAFHEGEEVTVHGDVHWHQVARTPEGELLLLDFENVARGHPSIDLVPSGGWIRRTGKPTLEQSHALRLGYGEPWPEQNTAQAEVSAEIAKFAVKTYYLSYP